MPGTSSYFKSHREARKSDYYSRGKASRSKALSTARSRGAMLYKTVEFKTVDFTDTNLATNTAGTIQLINGVTLGNDITNRVGRQVELRSVQLKGEVYCTLGGGVDQFNRVMIVYDRQTNGAALTILDVLTSVSPVSLRNLNNRKRFKILMDKLLYNNASGEPGSAQPIEYYRKLRHPVEFNANTFADVRDIQSGSLYVITIGSVVAGATAGNLFFSSRVRFTDV